MPAPVAFALAISNSFPSGTGSFNYEGSFQVVVQNLAYVKEVSVRADVAGTWKDIPASFSQSLPGDLEIWNAPASNSEGEFVASYTVNGVTFWDNNGGANYRFPQAFDEFVALSGREFPVVLGSAKLAGGVFDLLIGVRNLDFTKTVGAVYSSDNWGTVQTTFAGYSSTMKSGLEVWHATAPVISASEIRFALFYQVLGSQYWDNNFGRNYRVTPGNAVTWGNAP